MRECASLCARVILCPLCALSSASVVKPAALEAIYKPSLFESLNEIRTSMCEPDRLQTMVTLEARRVASWRVKNHLIVRVHIQSKHIYRFSRSSLVYSCYR